MTGIAYTLGLQVGDGGVTLNNIQVSYWSSTTPPAFPTVAWDFIFNNGGQGFVSKAVGTRFAWAVRPGDVMVAAVPEPASILLLGLGLAGLFVGRHRKAARDLTS